MKKILRPLLYLTFVLLLASCSELLKKTETPTKERMQGLWKVTEAYNDSGDTITDQINFPVTAFWLKSANAMMCTGGPMFMYVVYGENQYTNIASSVDQVFNYINLDYTDGEFFVADSVVERFTIEVKLEGLPGQKALTELLTLLGLNSQFLETTVYHKFRDVKVEFVDDDNMIWTLDNTTTAVYNKKDQYGDYVSWGGWSTTSFNRGRFVLQKQTVPIDSLVKYSASLPKD